jgi:hypothetical protein
MECNAFTFPQWHLWSELKKELDEDAFISRIRVDLKSGQRDHHGFDEQNGVLLYQNRLILPHRSQFILILLAEFHSNPFGGHYGEIKTCYFTPRAEDAVRKRMQGQTTLDMNNPAKKEFRDRACSVRCRNCF